MKQDRELKKKRMIRNKHIIMVVVTIITFSLIGVLSVVVRSGRLEYWYLRSKISLFGDDTDTNTLQNYANNQYTSKKDIERLLKDDTKIGLWVLQNRGYRFEDMICLAELCSAGQIHSQMSDVADELFVWEGFRSNEFSHEHVGLRRDAFNGLLRSTPFPGVKKHVLKQFGRSEGYIPAFEDDYLADLDRDGIDVEIETFLEWLESRDDK